MKPAVGRKVRRALLMCELDEGAGGVQVVFRDLVRWLPASGVEVDLIYPASLWTRRLHERVNAWGHRAFYCPMPAIVRGGTLVSMAAFLLYLPISLLSLFRLLRRHAIDVVNAHYLSPAMVHLGLAARLARVPFVVSVHGADLDLFDRGGWLYRLFLRITVRASAYVVAPSSGLAAHASTLFPEAAHRVTWVHNGFDLARFAAAPAPVAIPRPFVLCVCRQVEKKGVDTLLDAFATVRSQRRDCTLVVVGDGPLLETHKRRARELGLEAAVVFTGRLAREQVASLFAECALFVLPSRAEPFGVVILEAAFHARPVVATRVGGVPEILTDGEDGLLVEPGDAAGMAERIVAVLGNAALANRLGTAARRTLVERFTWQDRIADYLAVYEGRHAAPPHAVQARHPARSGLHLAAPGARSKPE